jgi:hypothetical protein
MVSEVPEGSRAPGANRTGASCVAALVGVAALAQPAAVLAQAPRAPDGGIYTCTDASGRRLTSDRPIPECVHREQQLLNRDGSLRAVVPPTLTPDERAEKEARDRKAAEARAAQQDAIRRDRNLMLRFPNEAAHQRAREAAAEPVRLAIRNTEHRLRELAAERKPLLNEAEFYPGRPLPPGLRQQIDANDAAMEAQRSLAANQVAELDRINALYDTELERLRRLWGGALPGSLGPLPAAAAVPRPAARAPVSNPGVAPSALPVAVPAAPSAPR